ncbi:unnamed protein product, partial [Brassica oleracea var. botrytis]
AAPHPARRHKGCSGNIKETKKYLLELGRWEMKHGRRVKLLENKRNYRQEKASS